jgi:hypothetical protein
MPVTPMLSIFGISMFPRSRHSSPVVFAATHDNRAVRAGERSGGGRSPAIIRRMSTKNYLGIATSAIWMSGDARFGVKRVDHALPA